MPNPKIPNSWMFLQHKTYVLNVVWDAYLKINFVQNCIHVHFWFVRTFTFMQFVERKHRFSFKCWIDSFDTTCFFVQTKLHVFVGFELDVIFAMDERTYGKCIQIELSLNKFWTIQRFVHSLCWHNHFCHI